MMMCGLHTQLFGGVAYTFYRLPVCRCMPQDDAQMRHAPNVGPYGVSMRTSCLMWLVGCVRHVLMSHVYTYGAAAADGGLGG